jgi:hypothetical protein
MRSLGRALLDNTFDRSRSFGVGTCIAPFSPIMKRYVRLVCPAWILGTFLLFIPTIFSSGVTLQELRNDAHLTPERFATYFADFQFELHEKVQPPEVFLATKKGDCDDYAILAAEILKQKGYTTRLVVVFMAKDIHVVCYVEETKSFLDFNRRSLSPPTAASERSLNEIAEKVAQSFRSKWHCVSEFTYTKGARQFVYTDFPQEKPSQEVASESKPATKPLVSQAQ